VVGYRKGKGEGLCVCGARCRPIKAIHATICFTESVSRQYTFVAIICIVPSNPVYNNILDKTRRMYVSDIIQLDSIQIYSRNARLSIHCLRSTKIAFTLFCKLQKQPRSRNQYYPCLSPES
jgi:hypothetical protein